LDARNSILTRMYVVLIALSTLPVLVFGQMLYIYLGEGTELREQGERQASSYQNIPAQRGSIFDRAGRTLVTNVARYDVALDPTAPGFSAQAAGFYEQFGRLTGRPASEIRRTVEKRTSRQYVLLVRNLDEGRKEKLEELQVPGLIMQPRFARRYNHGRIASHVLGHVDTDLNGTAGVELFYNDYLNGREGRRAVRRDRLGVIRPAVGGELTAPEHGEHLVLTIDLVRQHILEEELARGVRESGSEWGVAVAMDPRTGAILAMANVPDYDPNNPALFTEPARRNHAIVDRIEPGSTFKLVTAVAALEKGLVAPEDTVDSGNGYAVFRGRTMRDSHGYGRITFTDAIAKSSNVVTARLAMQLQPGDFYQYARNMGFGQMTWIDLPGEVPGSLKKPDRWSGVTQPWMSIGYEVEATPLQLLAAYSALANGGLLVQPFVVAERRDLAGRTRWVARQDSVRRAFRKDTAARLLPVFEQVVSREGTARLAAVEGLRIAGKTGTAQTASGGTYQRAYRASFVGMFPAEAPEVALIVIMNRPTNGYYGGAAAAPVFQRVAQRWVGTFPTIAQRIHPATPLPEAGPAPVPDVHGLPGVVAASRLRAAGFATKLPDARWRPVATQQPAAGDTTKMGKTVRLAAASGELETRPMPDLVGLSARQAVSYLASIGVAAQIEGTGVVTRQQPAAGAPLPQRAVLILR
jgi:cell division protein FtsI (penicillin-binding protein 3)